MNLLGVRLSGDLRGLLFEASVDSAFLIRRQERGGYSFPLPWGPVLLAWMWCWGQTLPARWSRRSRLGALREAISEGMPRSCGEEPRSQLQPEPGQSRCPGHCTITLRYAQTPGSFEQRGLRLLIPTVIAPATAMPSTMAV